MLPGREIAAVAKGRDAGGHGSEGVGLGGEGSAEDAHGV